MYLIKRLLPFFFLGILFLSSCKEDDDSPTPSPCDSVVCLNGGACDNGSCVCPDGYSGDQCETFDDCFGVTCLNEGTCVNGLCDCAEGFTGPSCANQITPQSIQITRIDIIRFPTLNSDGLPWDLGGDPDIFPKVLKGNQILLSVFNAIENADENDVHIFEISPPVSLDEPNDEYTISLFDEDDSFLDTTDDEMGAIDFIPYFSTNGFPSVISLDEGGEIAFEVHVTYIF